MGENLNPPSPNDVSDDGSIAETEFFFPSFPPPHYWDNLSQLFLEPRALQELNRRNAIEPQQSFRRGPRCLPVQDFLREISPADQAQLKRFARHGGPCLKDLTGCEPPSESEMPAGRSSLGRRKRGSQDVSKDNPVTAPFSFITPATPATHVTVKTKSTGPYDRGFGQHLIDNDIYPAYHDLPDNSELPPPVNLAEIQQALKRRRASFSQDQVTDQDVHNLKKALRRAPRESQVIREVMPTIIGDDEHPRCVAQDVLFNNLVHLTDGSLVSAKPDFYYGARPENLHKSIRKELSHFIVPSKRAELPVVPNNFVEVKGLGGTIMVGDLQTQYYVTLGARGIHSLRSYRAAEPKKLYDSKAYTIAWLFIGGILSCHACHPIQPSTPEAPAAYSTTHVDSWLLTTSSKENYAAAIVAFRNGRDWAKEQRDQIIAEANERFASRGATTSNGDGTVRRTMRQLKSHAKRPQANQGPSEPGASFSTIHESQASASADELALDHEPPTKRLRSNRGKPASRDGIDPIQGDEDQQKGNGVPSTPRSTRLRQTRRSNPASTG